MQALLWICAVLVFIRWVIVTIVNLENDEFGGAFVDLLIHAFLIAVLVVSAVGGVAT